MQFTRNIPSNDGFHFQRHDSRQPGHCIHGRCSDLCTNSRRSRTIYKKGFTMSLRTRLISQTKEMRIRQDEIGISWNDSRRRKTSNGPRETGRNTRLACSYESERSSIFPWIWKLLLEIYIPLFGYNLTSKRFNKERQKIWMEPQLSTSFRLVEEEIYRRTGLDDARPYETISNRIRRFKSSDWSSLNTIGF